MRSHVTATCIRDKITIEHGQRLETRPPSMPAMFYFSSDTTKFRIKNKTNFFVHGLTCLLRNNYAVNPPLPYTFRRSVRGLCKEVHSFTAYQTSDGHGSMRWTHACARSTDPATMISFCLLQTIKKAT